MTHCAMLNYLSNSGLVCSRRTRYYGDSACGARLSCQKSNSGLVCRSTRHSKCLQHQSCRPSQNYYLGRLAPLLNKNDQISYLSLIRLDGLDPSLFWTTESEKQNSCLGLLAITRYPMAHKHTNGRSALVTLHIRLKTKAFRRHYR